MAHFRIVGDVHGCISRYVELVSECENSLQLGDMGFSYKLIERHLSPERHRILAGNHDNYVNEGGVFVEQTPHFLGDFGTYEVPGIGKIFFVRGGRSIDSDQRTEHVDWWRDEELSMEKMELAANAYSESRPDFVVTHECPQSLISSVSTMSSWNGRPIRPSSTARLLEAMLVAHRPKMWIFGHYHRSWDSVVEGTRFRCLDELEIMDLEAR